MGFKEIITVLKILPLAFGKPKHAFEMDEDAPAL
jgi:hypothetical protein